MAHGAPDWWGQNVVDIIAQTLASMQVDVYAQTLNHVTNRPTYGAANIASFTQACGNGAITELASITGTGVIYGGHIWMSGTGTHAADVPALIVDGNTFPAVNSQQAYDRKIFNPGEFAFFIKHFDEVDYKISWGIQPGITFESSLVLKYTQFSGGACTAYGRVIYATV